MTQSLLHLSGVSRDYRVGIQVVGALRAIDLDIHSGEMIALVGTSGSGKSTLLNIIGCLDRPSSGVYCVAGQETSKMSQDALARLRCAYFGFIFQRYQLLPQLTARANVEVPAVYAGRPALERHARAVELLTRLGLAGRLDHRPNELSGGQQQRVSIARALMNGGIVILADEPTGALDSKTGEDVMNILSQLHALGHTIVIATHDRHVAGQASRIVEMSDGAIVTDQQRIGKSPQVTAVRPPTIVQSAPVLRFVEAARMAFLALLAHRLRTALTALGIIIGVVAVVMTVALGDSAQRELRESLASLRANMLEITPGKDLGDPRAGKLQTLRVRDVDILRRQRYVVDASPLISASLLLRHRSESAMATVTGVSEGYFDATGLWFVAGIGFDARDVGGQAQVVVIDENVRKQLFQNENPLGRTIYVGNLPCVVIGVTGRNRRLERKLENKLNVWIPYTVALSRLVGRSYLDSIVIRLRSDIPSSSAVGEVTETLSQLHHAQDFVIFNSDEDRRQAESLLDSLALIFAAIGVISLVVGGVGVMNIMLVSASERAREIGIRIAVGARRSDIRDQFLIESVVACLLGATGGIAISVLLAYFVRLAMPPDFEFVLSMHAIIVAVGCAVVTGVIAGYAPARRAARLDPVEALARD